LVDDDDDNNDNNNSSSGSRAWERWRGGSKEVILSPQALGRSTPSMPHAGTAGCGPITRQGLCPMRNASAHLRGLQSPILALLLGLCFWPWPHGAGDEHEGKGGVDGYMMVLCTVTMYYVGAYSSSTYGTISFGYGAWGAVSGLTLQVVDCGQDRL